jgi:hypothetical protein
MEMIVEWGFVVASKNHRKLHNIAGLSKFEVEKQKLVAWEIFKP